MRSSTFLRWTPLLLMLSGVVARDFSTGGGRSLLLDSCPEGCDKCVNQGSAGGKKCKTCYNGLVVLRSSNSAIDGACGCPAGTYKTGSGASIDCAPCTKGKWCPGGTLAASTETPCPDHMTTLAAGSKRVSACVNMPGYKFVPGASNAAPSATLCPINTYSPGLKQQKKCRACPSGFLTKPADDDAERTTIASCYAPPGYYVNAAGVAIACPKGEWKPDYANAVACTRCITGVTTEGPGKTSVADCNTLRPGFEGILAATAAGIESTSLCPRNKICTGVKLTSTSANAQGAAACDAGLWTQGQGSISPAQCQVPPGHTVDGSGDVAACAAGSYREGWTMIDGNTGCIPCGANFGTDVNAAPIAFYAADGSLIESIPAATSAESCYIDSGRGLYKKADGSFAARDCGGGSEYGASTRQYGLVAAPCKQCPLNMVVGAMANDANVGAFDPDSGLPISPDACVTQAGFGYDARTSQPCEKGTYAGGLTRNPCTPCAVGWTTNGEGKTSVDDCIGEAGLGGDGLPCPIGSYSTGGATPTCTNCNPGLSTPSEGAKSAAECSVCAAGYTADGDSCESCGAGSYSAGGMTPATTTACTNCPGTTAAFQGTNVPEADMFYTIAPTSPSVSGSAADCVPKFTQLVLDAYGPIAVDAGALSDGPTTGGLDACLAACLSDGGCQFVNFQYNADGTTTCKLKLVTEAPTAAGFTLVGFKQMPAGDVGALSKKPHGNATAKSVDGKSKFPWLRKRQAPSGANVGAKSVGNGLYTWWADASILASSTGLTGVTEQAGLDTDQCQDSCTMNNACAGVIFAVDIAAGPPLCRHIIPPAAEAGSVASNTRSLFTALPIRSDPDFVLFMLGI